MNEIYLPFAMAALVLLANLISIQFGLSVAIVEITLGVVGGNVLHMQSTALIDFLASFGSVILTFLTGVEVDVSLLRQNLRPSRPVCLSVGSRFSCLSWQSSPTATSWPVGVLPP